MNYLNAEDAISAREGTITVNIDGQVRVAAEVKNVTLTVDFDKEDFKPLGTSVNQKKITGWSGTGSMTVYYVTSVWNEIIMQYVKYKRTVPFTFTGTNEDPNSEIGKQTIIARMCKLDGGDVFKMNADDSYLEADYNFTFEDLEMPEKFKDYRTL